MARMAATEEPCNLHSYTDIEEIAGLRSGLLDWYDKNKRTLPWRTHALNETDPNRRAYGIWVSEIMLQQTQVVTVMDYYNRWMEKWPTVEALAAASLEEVNTLWAGLGYYSRGWRLWEAAKKVVGELNGQIPTTSDQLVKTLPGVGQYTASAIASMAFGEATGVVDGNVIRVLTRHRMIGGRVNNTRITQHLWSLSHTLVDPERPGDFNQSMMELGATICTPKSPSCDSCPIRSSCRVYRKVNSKSTPIDDAEGCHLCLAKWEPSLGVMNYPCKVKRKPLPSEHFAVAVIENRDKEQLLLRQRPPKGLLANLWEFPSVGVQPDVSRKQMWHQLSSNVLAEELDGDKVQYRELATVEHQFSHVSHHYHSWHIQVHSSDVVCLGSDFESVKWVNKHELNVHPVPTTVKKIYSQLTSQQCGGLVPKEKRKRHRSAAQSGGEDSKRQKTMDYYLSKKT